MSYAHPEYLVDTEWVANHLNDATVRIIESDEDPLLYPMGHIAGAVQVDCTRPVGAGLQCGWLHMPPYPADQSRQSPATYNVICGNTSGSGVPDTRLNAWRNCANAGTSRRSITDSHTLEQPSSALTLRRRCPSPVC